MQADDETQIITALRAHKPQMVMKSELKALLSTSGPLFNILAILWQDSETAVENFMRYDLANAEQRALATQLQGIIKGRRGLIMTLFEEALKPEDKTDE